MQSKRKLPSSTHPGDVDPHVPTAKFHAPARLAKLGDTNPALQAVFLPKSGVTDRRLPCI
jgi:hypothetical protein